MDIKSGLALDLGLIEANWHAGTKSGTPKNVALFCAP